MDTCAVILAAGQGTRMKTFLPKAMTEVLFKPMLDWVISALEAAGVNDICVVTGYSAEFIEEHLAGKYETVRQLERRGTGHAVMKASEFINRHINSNVLVLNGDAPLINAETISDACAYHNRKADDITVVTARIPDPAGYGRILRDAQGDIDRIVEEKDADEAQRQINEVNSGVYCFRAGSLLDALSKLKPVNSKNEYYLTDTIGIVNEQGGRVGAFTAKDQSVILGANTRRQLSEINEIARFRILDKLWDNGVDIPCTDGVIVGPDVEVGKDTRILPGTILRGKVTIGEKCVIGPNSYVKDSVIGDLVRFDNSQIRSAEIKSNCRIGPFAQIRPNSVICDRVHLGNFTEVKNSIVDEGTAVSHLTYVGDSDVGKDVNFGCGTVTVNFTGKEKFRTVIKDGAFIGCNTNLVAPVTIGKNAFTAAGSTITEDVPDNSLVIARSRQEVKRNWVIEHQPYRRTVEVDDDE